MALFKLCSYPGCRTKIPYGEKFCARHQSKSSMVHERPRESASARGYNYAWAKASKAFLKEHPLCEECLRKGKETPAQCVDHIKPWKGDRDLFWDSENWQALCNTCHSRKTAKEDGGFGNLRKVCANK